MFGSRRHHPPSQPLTAATADPNAATAAASAFSRQTSSSTLSSAAAAAALKARPHTPTNVSEVQTKRTRRRSASVSSAGSRDGGSKLRRPPSAGSMSERSLRSTSPHQPATRKPVEEPPPLPTIPDHAVPKSNGDARECSKRHSAQSLDLGSNATRDGNISWFVPPSTHLPPRVRTSHDSDRRPWSSGSSINFSYPRGARVASPSISPSTDKPMSRLPPTRPSTTGSAQELVYDPNSRRMIPRSELLALDQMAKQPRRKSTRKKGKPSSLPSSDSGAASFSKTKEAVSQTVKPGEGLALFAAPESVSDSTYHDKDAELFMEPKVKANESRSFSPGHEVNAGAIPATGHEAVRATSSSSRKAPDHPRYRAYRPPTAQVHEVAAFDEHFHDTSRFVDAVTVHTTTDIDNRGAVELPAEHVDRTSRLESPVQSNQGPEETGDHDLGGAAAAHHKIVSIAPKEKLAVPVRHSPPPRSISPIKSALKHPVGSNHTSSISDYGSEASADVTHQHVDPAVGRKKSVRVSFDDTSVVVGEAAAANGVSGDTHIPSSPVTKKRWYNLPRRRNSGASIEGGVDGEVMKPRPLLPSFGSIREKKAKPHEERPLVRPHAFTNTPPPAHLPTIPSDPHLGGHGAGFSSDHAIGTALTDGFAHGQESNTSRLREPLPPQVTSVEGDVFMSDESSDASLLNSDGEEQQEPFALQEDTATDIPPAPAAPESDVIHAEPSATDTREEDNRSAVNSGPTLEPSTESTTPSVSQIAVSNLSPRLEEGDAADSPHPSESDDFFEIPGTFPDNSSADTEAPSSWSPPQIIKSWWLGTKPEPGSGQSESSNPPTEEAVISPEPKSEAVHEVPSTIEEESEESGIFSDAYEDLSDIEEHGFQSLAAVAAQPVRSEASHKASDRMPPSASEETQERKDTTTGSRSAETSGTAPAAPEGVSSMDWEQAKTFWRSLSAEKRRQLELEAMQEAGIEGGLDESKPAVKPKKTKSAKKEQSKPEEAQPACPSVGTANAGQAGRFLRKTLRGPRPGCSDGAVTRSQPQSERQGKLRSPRSLTPAAPSEAPSEGGMRKSLRRQRLPEAVPTESSEPPAERPLSLPAPSLSFSQRLWSKPNKRPMSAGEAHRGPATTDWNASLPQRRGSFSSESSFKRSTPRPGSSGFRKTMRPGPDSPGMVPGSNVGKMGSFSLVSSSPPHPMFQQSSSFGSSPASTMRTRLRRELSKGSSWLFSLGKFSKKSDGQRSRDLDDSSEEDVPVELPSSPTARRPATANGATLTKAPAATAGEPDRAEEPSGELSGLDAESNQTSAAPPTNSPSANGTLSHSRSGRGSQLKPDRKGKGGFMSALRRRKHDQGRISRPERMESAARRDTKLERSAAELEALRNATPGRGDGDGDDDSVDVSLPSPRRRLEKRRGPPNVGNGSPEGKKKFAALRRALKMDE
ncbi:hypothetical protein VUR80DRAFT_2603 [Thermomyces stellatus]